MSRSVPDIRNKSGESLFSAIVNQFRSRPDCAALIFEDEELSYSQLFGRTSAIAEQLHKLGVSRGDRVALLFPNHPEFVASFFAVVGLAAVVVPVNPLLKSEEIAHILSDSGAKVLIVDKAGLSEALAALSSCEGATKMPSLESILVRTVGDAAAEALVVKAAGQLGEVKLEHLTASTESEQEPPYVDDVACERELALIVYTSGTTGKPKGAMLTHNNMSSALKESLFEGFEISAADRILGVLPLCHIYGIGVLVYSSIVRGTPLLIMPKFDAPKLLQAIGKHQITFLPLVPSMYQFLLMEMENTQYDLKSLRFCISAAAPLSAELLEEIETEMGVTVIEGYGMSETACGGTVNPTQARRIGSVGKPLSCLEMAIRSEQGEFLPAGSAHVGEIAIKGNCVMQGYHGKPEATAEAFAGDWFLTGDLGYKDEEGYFFIVGRKKELIIRGGANIYPREVEEVIARMPEVRDVAVIGVPDKLMGERVKAIIVLADACSLTDQQVKEHCEKHLAQYKVPRLVEFRTELPRNSTGKILKRALS